MISLPSNLSASPVAAGLRDGLLNLMGVETMTDETYNGWTNRETWAVALHIDNDEGLQNCHYELCKTAVETEATEYLTKEQAAKHRLSKDLQKWVEEISEDVYFPNPQDGRANLALLGMFHDIGSLWRVNWDEIAANWLQDFEDAA